ncbi:putative mfs transporter [Phaeomoniella chlamydospora]|uniref:Putative mfs transporter n=1 Tax=Phaeomoniella chlamydospora TaxID=158046 RepID=A0A0G2GNL3_PHACM|nr:putative mfs transporter [Phaeomoniella chlamydospora]
MDQGRRVSTQLEFPAEVEEFTRRRRSTLRDTDNHPRLSLSARPHSHLGHREALEETLDDVDELPAPIKAPESAIPGPLYITREVPSALSTRPPSPEPSLGGSSTSDIDIEDTRVVTDFPDVGTLRSKRGILILSITAGAQLIDNVFMTGTNIALPAIQKELDVSSADLQWMISAYTLTFGGFLLLSGVLSDRYGRRNILCGGLAFLSACTLAVGFGTSFTQVAIFRALQGIGAALTVPSSIGIISSYFVAQDRTRALSIFGASGAVGFCVGLVLGGFLTSALSWRYLFRLTVIITGTLGVLGFWILPRDRLEGHSKPKLDFLGAGFSTAGLILLSFVLSSGGVYGWNKAFIIALLICSVALLVLFTYFEKKVSNPIMPLSLWKIKNFAGLWISGFVVYGSYQAIVYYTVLVAQEVNGFSAGATALRFLPMGIAGFTTSITMGSMVDRFNVKHLLLAGTVVCMIAPIPAALIKTGDVDFWKHVFPSSILGVVGVSIVYVSVSVIMLASVPVNVKSLCGGMVNTAFQIGSGVALALSSAIVQAVQKGHTTNSNSASAQLSNLKFISPPSMIYLPPTIELTHLRQPPSIPLLQHIPLPHRIIYVPHTPEPRILLDPILFVEESQRLSHELQDLPLTLLIIGIPIRTRKLRDPNGDAGEFVMDLGEVLFEIGLNAAEGADEGTEPGETFGGIGYGRRTDSDRRLRGEVCFGGENVLFPELDGGWDIHIGLGGDVGFIEAHEVSYIVGRCVAVVSQVAGDLVGGVGGSTLRDVFDVERKALGFPHLPIGDPGNTAVIDGGCIEGEIGGVEVPGNGDAAFPAGSGVARWHIGGRRSSFFKVVEKVFERHLEDWKVKFIRNYQDCNGNDY